MSQLQASVVVSPLRQRMIDDMTMRGSATRYAARLHPRCADASPPSSGGRPIRRRPRTCAGSRSHQHESGVPAADDQLHRSRRCASSSPSRSTGRTWRAALVLAAHPRKLPAVLSVEEVGRLLEAAPGLKHKAALGDRLWRGPARVRGGAPQGRRYRQQAHADPRRAGQGRARTATPCCRRNCSRCCGCGGRKAGGAASCCRTAGCSRAQLPRCRSRTRQLHRVVHRGSRGRRHRKRVGAAHAAPQLRHPPAGDRTSTSASSRSCSGTPSSIPPRSTPRLRPGRSAR